MNKTTTLEIDLPALLATTATQLEDLSFNRLLMFESPSLGLEPLDHSRESLRPSGPQAQGSKSRKSLEIRSRSSTPKQRKWGSRTFGKGVRNRVHESFSAWKSCRQDPKQGFRMALAVNSAGISGGSRLNDRFSRKWHCSGLGSIRGLSGMFRRSASLASWAHESQRQIVTRIAV